MNTFDVAGNLTDREKEVIEEVMKLFHERISQMKFRRIFYKVDGKVNYVYNIRAFTASDVNLGINSNSFTSRSDRHILMADLDMKDGVTLKDIKENLIAVQEEFDLPKIHIYRSSPTGLFALCFTDLSYDELMLIQSKIKHEDINHLFCLFKNKFLTLRLQKKKEKEGSDIRYLATLEHKSSRTELLGAQAMFERMVGLGDAK